MQVNSHPIFEDCTELGFASYDVLSYDTVIQDISRTQLTSAACWYNVIDFKWHKDTPSPYYYLITDKKMSQMGNKVIKPHVFSEGEGAGDVLLPLANKFTDGKVGLVDGWSLSHSNAGTKGMRGNKTVAAASTSVAAATVAQVGQNDDDDEI